MGSGIQCKHLLLKLHKMGLAGAQTLPEHLPGLHTFGGSCFQEDSDQHMLASLTCTAVPNRFSRAGLMGLFSQELKQIRLGMRSLAWENYTRIGSCISVSAQREEHTTAGWVTELLPLEYF